MSEPAERIAAVCPSCGDSEETVHEVLAPGNGGHATVRCTECGHTHKVPVEEESTVEVDVVVSQDGESFTARTEIPPTEWLEVGDEFIVDTPEAIMQVRITSLGVGDERRDESSRADYVNTIWTRAVDNVTVPVTIHPKDGNRDESRSVTLSVPGDEELVVGEEVEVGGDEFVIQGLQVRDDAAEGYRFEKFDKDGDMVFAKDLKRIYGRDTTTTAWSAW
ncbi:MAG: HVO_0476 family zinc finger protein [Haloferacaceae archaeon]